MGSTQSVQKSSTKIGNYDVDEFEYEWTISKFQKLLSSDVGYSVNSDVLTVDVGNEKDTYKVVLYPNGLNERGKGYVSLWLQKISAKERLINFSCTIVDVNGRELLKKSLKQVLSIQSFLGWMTFCHRHIFLEEDCKFLKDGTLTLKCLLQIFSDNALANAEVEDVDLDIDKSLSSDLRSLVTDEVFHDFFLLVQNEKLHVHRAILSARSPVFKALLNSPLTNKNFIKISDISKPVIREMLNFLYTGEVCYLNVQEASDLYYAADKYEICHLKNICSRVIKANLEPDNVLNALLLSDRHSDVELQEVCIQYIVKNITKVQEQTEWMELLKNQPFIANLVIKRVVLKKA